jgi:hypothetical protein
LSRAGRDNRARLGAATADLPHVEPASRAELRDALRDFAARGVDLLAGARAATARCGRC